MSQSQLEGGFFDSKRRNISYQLRKVMPNLSLTGSTLEVGCGRRGWFSLLVRQKSGCFLITSDADADKVRTAKKVASEIGLASDHYITCDVAHMPFCNNTFSKVIGNAVLHHVLPDLNMVVMELQRVLAKSGEVLFTGEIVASRFLGWLWKMIKLRHYADEDITTHTNWRKTFMSNGFSLVSIKREDRCGYSNKRSRNVYYFFCQLIPNCVIVRYGLTSCTISATCYLL